MWAHEQQLASKQGVAELSRRLKSHCSHYQALLLFSQLAATTNDTSTALRQHTSMWLSCPPLSLLSSFYSMHNRYQSISQSSNIWHFFLSFIYLFIFSFEGDRHPPEGAAYMAFAFSWPWISLYFDFWMQPETVQKQDGSVRSHFLWVSPLASPESIQSDRKSWHRERLWLWFFLLGVVV